MKSSFKRTLRIVLRKSILFLSTQYWRNKISHAILLLLLLLDINHAQTITRINPQNLKVVTPGKNGVPFPKTVKAGSPKITPNKLAPVAAGEPRVVEINSNTIRKITPGKNNIPLPKVFIIPDSGNSVQHGVTIHAPQTVIAKQPSPAKPRRSVRPH